MPVALKVEESLERPDLTNGFSRFNKVKSLKIGDERKRWPSERLLIKKSWWNTIDASANSATYVR
jgi:hypothetical protein